MLGCCPSRAAGGVERVACGQLFGAAIFSRVYLQLARSILEHESEPCVEYTLRLERGARRLNLIIIGSGRMPRRKPYDQQALGWLTTHAEHRKWESKRERPIKNSGPALFSGVDWPALFFWALVVAFVVWPTAQSALRYWLS